MAYYFIHPFKPQFFFPKGFKKHAVFKSFYKPFSVFGATSWWLFVNCYFYRLLFKKVNIEPYIPEAQIRNLCGKNSLLAFNLGTSGPEQKITALGIENDTYFFIKYAQTSLAIFNVTNEYKVLNTIKDLDFVPQILDFYRSDKSVLLKTNVFHGEKLGAVNANQSIIDLLILLSKIQIDFNHNEINDLQLIFSHGDFCPWNIMLVNHKLQVYDWEMAGMYPVGYDLFTYIFQTAFLLRNSTSIESILNTNNHIINQYFMVFEILDWTPFLNAFAEKKIKLESKKNGSILLPKYLELKKHITHV